MIRKCEGCGCEIPQARLEVLPETTRCVNCSTEKRKVGFMISQFSKGTASEIVFVDVNDKEQMRLADRANKRRR